MDFPRSLLLACLLAFLGGCQSLISDPSYHPSQVDAQPADGGTFVEASIGDASFLNPILSSDSASNDICGLVFNGLVKYDKNLQLIGDLAEKWTVSKDGKTFTFYLKKNVKWHDGQEFTAEDVNFTYLRLIDPQTRTPFSTDYQLVKKAEVVGTHIFRVVYDQPFAPALESWGMGILPKHVFEKGDINTHPANKKPIGTGPYIFSSWKADEKIELRANPDYFEGRPHFDRYVYRIIPDQSVQFLELRQESLDLMNPTPDQYNGYEAFFKNYQKFKYPAFQYDYVGFNLHNELFQDRRIRKAIALAINKRDIIEGVYQGLAVPATGPFPPASWAFDPSVKDIPFDPVESKRILAEAGWRDNNADGILEKGDRSFQFTLITNHGNKVRDMITQVIQNNLGYIGIKVDIRILEWSVFLQFIDEKNFEACVLGWTLSRDPDCFQTWHSSQVEKRQYNFISYQNPEVDRLLVEGRTTFDKEKRKGIYHRIHRIIADDVPYVFLVNPMSRPVVHKKILGIDPGPAGLTWNFIKWYVPKAWQDRTAFAN